MKKTLAFLLMIFAVMGLFAQQPVVAPFDVISGISTADAEIITRVFFIELGNTRELRLVDRNVVEQVLREHNFQAGDWSDQDKTARLNEALNADWIVRGRIEKFSNGFVVTIELYDLKFEYKGGHYALLDNAMDAYNKMKPLVSELMTKIKVAPGTRAPANRTTPGPTYKIGDTGPAGGIVFYDKGIFSNGWRYLEAAPAGAEFTAGWGGHGGNVANIVTALGFGKQNTQIIVERLNAWGESNRAAQICAAMDINGYKDWFLPSKDELDWMYKNLKQKGLGSFGTGWYWSSSQYSTASAWYQRFSDGMQYGNGSSKIGTNPVRAIRSF